MIVTFAGGVDGAARPLQACISATIAWLPTVLFLLVLSSDGCRHDLGDVGVSQIPSGTCILN